MYFYLPTEHQDKGNDTFRLNEPLRRRWGNHLLCGYCWLL